MTILKNDTLGEMQIEIQNKEMTSIVRFYSKGNPLQVYFQSFHVPAMQKILFENRLADLHFSYK